MSKSLKERRIWKTVDVPFEMFDMTTAKAMKFKFRSGSFKDCEFFRPLKTIRRHEKLTGFVLGYTCTQTLDNNGDVVAEENESITLTKSTPPETQNGKWLVEEITEIDFADLGGFIE